MTRMRITEIETIQVIVPYIPAIRKYRPNEEKTRGPIPIVRVHTDEGITGLGEGFRGQNFEAVAQRLLGADPLTINLAELDAPFHGALYDIVGKALKVPAYRLMGGKCRDRVPVGYWSCHMTPEDTAKEAEVGAKLGFTTHKLKARPEDIVRQVDLISKAGGPGYSVLVDPNFIFVSLTESMKIARQLESYNILCFEDPFPWANNPTQYRLFRQRTDIPLAPHVSRLRSDIPGDTLNRSGRTRPISSISPGRSRRCRRRPPSPMRPGFRFGSRRMGSAWESARPSRSTSPPRCPMPRYRATSSTSCASMTLLVDAP